MWIERSPNFIPGLCGQRNSIPPGKSPLDLLFRFLDFVFYLILNRNCGQKNFIPPRKALIKYRAPQYGARYNISDTAGDQYL